MALGNGLLPPVVVTLLAETKQFTDDMAKAGAEMKGFATEAETSGSRIGSAFSGLASAGGVLAVGMLAVGAESVKMASDFQASMEKLHTQANVPQAQIKALSNDVLDLAGKVGTNPDSLAEALFHVESTFQSTGKTGKEMMDILRVGAEGARVGGSNLVDTQNALDAAIVSGIRGAENLDSAMGLLNATVGVGDMTMQNLAEALSSGVMPVVKNYGLSLTDVGAALATFGDNNIRGAQAGTALRMSVQALAVPVKGGEAALKALGMTTSTLAKDMQSGGLLKALEDLKTHMTDAGITGDKVGEELTTIFGKRAGTGVAVLINGLDLLKSKYPELTAAAGGFGDAWAGTQATFKQQVADLRAQLDAWMIQLGTKLIPIILQVAKGVNELVGWLKQHTEVAKLLAVAVGSVLVAALVAAAVAFGSFIAEAAMVVVPIAAVATGVYYAYTHFKLLRDIVADIGSFFEFTFRKIARAIDDFRGGWENVNASIASSVGPFETTFLRFGQIAHETATGIVSAWRGLATASVAAWNAIYGAVASVVGPMVGFIQSEVQIVTDWVRSHWEEIRQATDKIWGAISAVVGMWWENIKLVVLTALDILKVELDVAWAYISGSFQVTWDLISGAMKGTWDFLTGVVRLGTDTVLGIIGVFLDLFTGHWSQAWHDAKDTVGNVLSDIWNLISTTFNDALSLIWNLAGDFYDAAVSIGRAIVNGAVDGIINFGHRLVSAARGVVGDAISGAKSLLGISSPSKVFEEIGANVGLGMIVGLNRQANDVSLATLKMMGNIPGTANVKVGATMTGLPSSYSIPVSADAVFAGGPAGASGGSSGAGVTINLNGNITLPNVTDGRGFFESVQAEALRYQRANGTTGIRT